MKLLFVLLVYLHILSTEVALGNCKTIPKKIIVGYCNWGQCDQSIIEAVKDGVNVLIWFSINLSSAYDEVAGRKYPAISGGPDMSCVGNIVTKINALGLDVVHLISIGGWNSPHPDTSFSPEEMYDAFNIWNRKNITFGDFNGFDGIDWDIEGNDTPTSDYNHFSIACLDLMGRFSQLAKANDYVVAMAPAESYLDPSTHLFDRSLLHTYPEYSVLQPTFAYHGHNCYAYLLAKYGTCDGHDTFDFITVQLYEGYSHANYHIEILKESATSYLMRFVHRMNAGWTVNFSSDPETLMPNQMLQIAADKLVIGLANGWAGDGKFLFIAPDEVGRAYADLFKKGLSPRGFAFWNILDEGKESAKMKGTPVWMARGLNSFLKIRT